MHFFVGLFHCVGFKWGVMQIIHKFSLKRHPKPVPWHVGHYKGLYILIIFQYPLKFACDHVPTTSPPHLSIRWSCDHSCHLLVINYDHLAKGAQQKQSALKPMAKGQFVFVWLLKVRISLCSQFRCKTFHSILKRLF